MCGIRSVWLLFLCRSRCPHGPAGGYDLPLRPIGYNSVFVGAAICRVNCTQCKRHEAPNALAFGRNSPGDCFVASATIPPPPTAVPLPLQGRQKSYKFLRSLCLQLVPVSHPDKKPTFFCSPLCRNAKIWYNSCETVCIIRQLFDPSLGAYLADDGGEHRPVDRGSVRSKIADRCGHRSLHFPNFSPFIREPNRFGLLIFAKKIRPLQ